jgi:hypothetical protein
MKTFPVPVRVPVPVPAPRTAFPFLPFRYQHSPSSIHIRGPTFTEAVQVSHVYPVTSFVRVSPPVTYFAAEVTALLTRVRPSIRLLRGPNWGICSPLTSLHVPFKNSNCTPFTPFHASDVIQLPKIQLVVELRS